MATLIIITNRDSVVNSPAVYVVRDCRHGTSTTLGLDKSEARALEIAQEYKNWCGKDVEIINLYDYRPTMNQYFDYIIALDEYYNAWNEGRYTEAPDLMTKCAQIKNAMRKET